MRMSATTARFFGDGRRTTGEMTFVTKLTLRSGDRAALEETVAEIKEFVGRKGAEMKGPHPRPPAEYTVSLPTRLERGDSFSPWSYTVYQRDLEIVGHDAVARAVASRTFPRSLQIVLEVEQLRSAGDF